MYQGGLPGGLGGQSFAGVASILTGGDWQAKPRNWATPDPVPPSLGGGGGLPGLGAGQAALAQKLAASVGDLGPGESTAIVGGKLTDIGGQGGPPLVEAPPASSPDEWANPFGVAAPPSLSSPAKPSSSTSSSSSAPTSSPVPVAAIAVGALVLLLLVT